MLASVSRPFALTGSFKTGRAWGAQQIIEEGGRGIVKHGLSIKADSQFGNVAMIGRLGSLERIGNFSCHL